MVVRKKARAAIRAEVEAWACSAQAAFHRVFLPNEALCSTTHEHPRTKERMNLVVPRGLLGDEDNRLLGNIGGAGRNKPWSERRSKNGF